LANERRIILGSINTGDSTVVLLGDAAAVRNRWGEIANPIVCSVIL
jgi:hypothetical protein